MIDFNEELTPLIIQQECFVTLYKAVYGVKPRFGTEEQWDSIEWLQEQINTLVKENP
jgi:hypothetical protein